jgi:uncharacterized protein (TIGR02246 family)
MKQMSGKTPEDLEEACARLFNEGDLEGLFAFYEKGATLITVPGEVVTGADAIRETLKDFLAAKAKMSLKPRTIAQAGDIALTTSVRTLKGGNGPDGKPMSIDARGTAVARRQADGAWRYVIDNPHG